MTQIHISGKNWIVNWNDVKIVEWNLASNSLRFDEFVVLLPPDTIFGFDRFKNEIADTFDNDMQYALLDINDYCFSK